MRSPRGVLFSHECLGLMNTFVKDEVAQVVPIMEYVKQIILLFFSDLVRKI